MFLVVAIGGERGSLTQGARPVSHERGDIFSAASIKSGGRVREFLREQKSKAIEIEKILLQRLEQSRLGQKLSISATKTADILRSVAGAIADHTVVGPIVTFAQAACSMIKLGESKALKNLLIKQLADQKGLEEFIFKRVVDAVDNQADKQLLTQYRDDYRKARSIEEIRDIDERIEKDPDYAGIRNLLTKVDSVALLRKLSIGAISPKNLTAADKNELAHELAELTLLGVAGQENTALVVKNLAKFKEIFSGLIENCDKPEYRESALKLSEELSKLLSGHFLKEFFKLSGNVLMNLIPGQSIAKCFFSILPEELQEKLALGASACKEKIKRLTFAEQVPNQEEVITFRKLYSKTLSAADRQNIEAIVKIDPYFNGGASGITSDGKVNVASKAQALELLNIYSEGGIFQYKDDHGNLQNASLEPLSKNARKSLTALVTWYLGYRSNFPDPTETQPLKNIFPLITGTMEGHLKWDICTILSEQGDILSAFSGQAIKAGGLTVAWGEHIYCDKEARGSGYGAKALEKFNRAASELCGKTDGFVIEMDNPFAIRDSDDPANFVFFNHSDRSAQRAAWTDPDGQNMAMNPFERMKVWHKLGFKLIAVQRSDLEKSGLTALPYTQIPLDSLNGEPCEILVMAIKPGQELERLIQSEKIGASNVFEVYKAMMQSISADYENEASYQATAKELELLASSKITLVDICDESGRNFNPKAMEMLQRTARHKLKRTIQ